jgi:hypothetical protein
LGGHRGRDLGTLRKSVGYILVLILFLPLLV